MIHYHFNKQNMSKNILELEWDEMIIKLNDLRYMLTPEEEETIKNIVNKY